MSEHDSESSSDESAEASSGSEGVDGLQESKLDSVTGGGDGPKPIMDLQSSDPDRVEKSDDGGALETKDVPGGDRDADDSDRDGER